MDQPPGQPILSGIPFLSKQASDVVPAAGEEGGAVIAFGGAIEPDESLQRLGPFQRFVGQFGAVRFPESKVVVEAVALDSPRVGAGLAG